MAETRTSPSSCSTPTAWIPATSCWVERIARKARRSGYPGRLFLCPGRDALRKVRSEDALKIFRDQWALGLIAFIEKSHPESEADVTEDQRILCPADHGARAHHGRNIAI